MNKNPLITYKRPANQLVVSCTRSSSAVAQVDLSMQIYSEITLFQEALNRYSIGRCAASSAGATKAEGARARPQSTWEVTLTLGTLPSSPLTAATPDTWDPSQKTVWLKTLFHDVSSVRILPQEIDFRQWDYAISDPPRRVQRRIKVTFIRKGQQRPAEIFE